MRLFSLALLVVSILCNAASSFLLYHMGYNEESYAPLVYNFYLFILSVACGLLLAVNWTYSLAVRKQRVWTTAMVAGFVVMTLGYFLSAPAHEKIGYGLRDRLVHEFDPDTLRRFAREIDRLPHPAARPDEPPEDASDKESGFKSFERGDMITSGLRDKYPFLGWMRRKGNDDDGPANIFERDGIVFVNWGGVLDGHWGFQVKVDGGKLSPSPERDSKSIPISDDIAVVLD